MKLSHEEIADLADEVAVEVWNDIVTTVEGDPEDINRLCRAVARKLQKPDELATEASR